MPDRSSRSAHGSISVVCGWGVSMVSRLERTPFAAWWWTVDRVLAGGAARAHARRHRAVARRKPAGRFPARARAVLFRQPARALFDPGARRAADHLVPAAALYSPASAHRLRAQSPAGRRHAAFRRRGQGRAPLDRPARGQHPALGIPQARLRDPDRVAVRRIRAAAGNAGQHDRVWRCCWSPSPDWCCSPISARPC